jgi:hypothetical protein
MAQVFLFPDASSVLCTVPGTQWAQHKCLSKYTSTYSLSENLVLFLHEMVNLQIKLARLEHPVVDQTQF